MDGVAILNLKADRMEVRIQQGLPVARQRFHFYDPLPETGQPVKLQVRAGRGYVHIVDQPRAENQFTLAVIIEDRQPGSALYSIALYWDTSNKAFERHPGHADRISWSGRVDQEAVISCQDKTCTAGADQGAPVADEHYKFSHALPRREVEVALEDQQGRGDIRLIEQPSESNHYTVRISIQDPQAGAGEYSFALVWTRPNEKQPVPVMEPTRGLTWMGVVGGRARVTVEGGAAFSQVLEGPLITGEQVDFARPLPRRSDLHPLLKKLQGRGQVAIIEYPSEKNRYRLIFEVVDPSNAGSGYEIEVDW